MLSSCSSGPRAEDTRCISLLERQAALHRLPPWESVRTAWQRLVSLPPGAQALAVVAVGPDGASARVVDDSGTDAEPLLAAVTIGRHVSCDLWLDADTASRRHLVVVAQGTTLASIDLRSSLGTIHAPLPTNADEPLIVFVGDVVVAAAVAGPGRALPALPEALSLPEAGLVLRPPPRVSALVHAGVRRIELPFDDGVLIGRSERCDVIVLDEGVSRIHAALLRVGDGTVVVDVGSSNGTHVKRADGSEVALGPVRRICALLPGDIVEIGSVEIVIHDLRAPAPPVEAKSVEARAVEARAVEGRAREANQLTGQ
jgi:pSer/pThr/pTyr-binding forkhead associated (FHA) protein